MFEDKGIGVIAISLLIFVPAFWFVRHRMLTNKYVYGRDWLALCLIAASLYFAWHGANLLLAGNWAGNYSASFGGRSENVAVEPIALKK